MSVAATEQVHVHEQRAAANDLHELAHATGAAPAACGSAPTAPAEASPCARAHELAAPLTAVGKPHHRRTRDEAAGGHGRGLHGRHHRAGFRALGKRPDRRRHHDGVHFLGVAAGGSGHVGLERVAHGHKCRERLGPYAEASAASAGGVSAAKPSNTRSYIR